MGQDIADALDRIGNLLDPFVALTCLASIVVLEGLADQFFACCEVVVEQRVGDIGLACHSSHPQALGTIASDHDAGAVEDLRRTICVGRAIYGAD